MEHQSQEDGEKWAAQLNTPLPGQAESAEDDAQQLALFKTML
jgi:hypothetical protein